MRNEQGNRIRDNFNLQTLLFLILVLVLVLLNSKRVRLKEALRKCFLRSGVDLLLGIDVGCKCGFIHLRSLAMQNEQLRQLHEGVFFYKRAYC